MYRYFVAVLIAFSIATPAFANSGSATLVRSSSQTLSAADSASLSITSDLAIEACVYITSAPSSGTLYGLVTKDDLSSNRSFALDYYNNGGTPQLRMGIFANGAGSQYSESSFNYNLGTNTWVRIGMSVDVSEPVGTKFTWYINGVSQGNGSSNVNGSGGATSIYNGTAPFVIGNYGAFGSYANAKIDDVRLWSGVRDQSSMSAAWNTELTGSETNLQAYYKLNNSLSDQTANANNLTNNNGVTFTSDPCFGAVAVDEGIIWYFQ